MLSTTTRTICSAAAGPSRYFSTSLPRGLKQRKVLVELLEDVPGVGSAWDCVFVGAGKQRNILGPQQLSRIVPWKTAKGRTEIRTRISPGGPSRYAQIPAPGLNTPSPPPPDAAPLPTPQPLLDALHLLPQRLTFPLRTISPTSSTLHGSLTLSDVQEKLAGEHGLPGTVVSVSWSEEGVSRIKELGVYKAVVQLREGGKEEVSIEVEAVRLE